MNRVGSEAEDLLRAAARFARSIRSHAVEVTVRMHGGGKVKLPVPPHDDLPDRANGRDTILDHPKAEFVPTRIQQLFLDAMAGGRAVRTSKLEEITGGNKSQVFPTSRKGGILELIAHGLVTHHRRLGYYLVADPPAELVEEEEEEG